MPLRRTLMASIPNRKGLDMNANTLDPNALSSEGRKLLEILLLKGGKVGRVQISTGQLLEVTGLTEGALIRARTELTRGHLMCIEPGFSRSGLRGANVYVLNMPVLDPPEVRVVAEPVTVSPALADPVGDDVLEGSEEVPESSKRQGSGRKGFLGFFRRGRAAS